MIVMPANNTGFDLGWIARAHPDQLGWLFSPDGWRHPRRGLPYALDNGAFTAFNNDKPWDEDGFTEMLEKADRLPYPPLWVLVPDVVANREATLALWQQWCKALRDYGWPLAFAVQDGMTQADVPKDADVIFVGGSTTWKWATVQQWCKDNPRVHVGRVNGFRGLWLCRQYGAESCDGTGWFRGDDEQLAGLERYLEQASGAGLPEMPLFGSV